MSRMQTVRDTTEARTASGLASSRTGRQGASWLSRLVQRAPGIEAPDTRDRAGAQRGMLIVLVGAAAFWLGVAALAVYLLG